MLGKLLVALGPERIVWGTDCAWYGSPQPLIDAFRAFVIPDEMQVQFGYPRADRRDEGTHPQRERAGVVRLSRPRRASTARGPRTRRPSCGARSRGPGLRPAPRADNDSVIPTITANGIDLYYERSGSGPRLLFLNGSGSTLATSALLIAPFAERFDVRRARSARSRAAPRSRPVRTRWPTTPPTRSRCSTRSAGTGAGSSASASAAWSRRSSR